MASSFVSRLRMANMFPINSNLGNARINVSNDNYDEIISQALSQRMNSGGRMNINGGEGMRMMGQNMRSQPNEQPQLKFGGVVGHDSNPGADILNRSKINAERLYKSYSEPQITADEIMGRVGKPSNDAIDLENYFNRKNKETVANAAAANAGNKGWKTVNITDPNDPSKTTAIQVNDNTGETRDINLPGQITNKETPGSIQKRIDTKNAAANANKAYLDKTSDSLTLIKDLMDDNDNLTPEGARATGKSAVGNYIPFTMGYTGSTKIGKLKSEQVLNLIGQLKAQSKTGATGMGNMSNKDLGVIEKAATLLNTGLPEEEFKKQLKIVKDELKDIQTRLTMGDETPNSTMKPAVSHNTVPTGKIKVRRKSDGKMGFISKLTPEFEAVQ